MIEKVFFQVGCLPKKRNISLTLGNFDGFHLGHQRLAFDAFSSSSGDNAILLFSKSYKNYFLGEPLLTDLEQRLALSESNRYEVAYVLHSSIEAFSLTPSEFEDMLHNLGAKELFVGEDYRYGKEAKGNPDTLREAGFKVHVTPLLKEEGEKVSSTRIRTLLEEGKAAEAASLLGRPYEMKGKVIKGKQIGRTLGFPTANLGLLSPFVIPSFGAYAGRAMVRGVPHLAMISVGRNPRISDSNAPTIEAHLLDFEEDIYGESMSLSFYSLLRPMKRFDDIDSLKRQLQEDKENAKEYFLSLEEY